ncbi:hypothetical protein C8R46DRAFT_1047913 [Mycena filopes]|nr:hypothetical protein C8R46DRAFT_1047913 [Mycena filopes]
MQRLSLPEPPTATCPPFAFDAEFHRRRHNLTRLGQGSHVVRLFSTTTIVYADYSTAFTTLLLIVLDGSLDILALHASIAPVPTAPAHNFNLWLQIQIGLIWEAQCVGVQFSPRCVKFYAFAIVNKVLTLSSPRAPRLQGKVLLGVEGVSKFDSAAPKLTSSRSCVKPVLLRFKWTDPSWKSIEAFDAPFRLVLVLTATGLNWSVYTLTPRYPCVGALGRLRLCSLESRCNLAVVHGPRLSSYDPSCLNLGSGSFCGVPHVYLLSCTEFEQGPGRSMLGEGWSERAFLSPTSSPTNAHRVIAVVIRPECRLRPRRLASSLFDLKFDPDPVNFTQKLRSSSTRVEKLSLVTIIVHANLSRIQGPSVRFLPIALKVVEFDPRTTAKFDLGGSLRPRSLGFKLARKLWLILSRVGDIASSSWTPRLSWLNCVSWVQALPAIETIVNQHGTQGLQVKRGKFSYDVASVGSKAFTLSSEATRYHSQHYLEPKREEGNEVREWKDERIGKSGWRD